MSEAAEELRRTLASWNATRMALARTSGTPTGEWRLEIVRMRRTLQEQIAAMTTALADIAQIGGSLEAYKACRNALSVVRTHLALHQSEWPAVAIRPEDPAYQRSAMALRQANDAFARSADRLLQWLATAPPSNIMKETR